MSDIIHLLPDTVANQIAAGEVIQRPASVIKERVENAIDAQATHIQVRVVDAGRTSIQVIDNGKGMSETDVRMAFERHATSKITEADDLFNLHTMGFRGEALASIAAVAQVELKSRMADHELGSHISISGSKVTGQEPVACPVGSNFIVNNLFFNVPARRKFLKTNATELNQIMTVLERIMLVYPNVSFTFHSNEMELMNLKPGSLKQRIVDIFGKRISQDLLSLQVETSVGVISGFVEKPESAKKRGAHEYFFVNGRFMKHPYFHKAVMNAFERLVQPGTSVPYFIYFQVNPSDIDVNIHPTKTEIKFENEQTLWQILTATIKDAIGSFCEVDAIDFDTVGKPEIPLFDPSQQVEIPLVDTEPAYNPFTSSSSRPSAAPAHWEQLYEGTAKTQSQPETPSLFDEQASQDEEFFPLPDEEFLPPIVENRGTAFESLQTVADKSPVHYQYKARLILTAVKSGLMIIDQHRADIRIRFEQYLDRSHPHPTQKVLFPEVITFTAAQSAIIPRVLPELASMGFELTFLGQNSYGVNGVPAGIEGLNPVHLLTEMVAKVVDLGGAPADNLIQESLALSMASQAALPVGQILNNEEMEALINSLFACSNVNYTPDGKKIITILPQHDLERMLE